MKKNVIITVADPKICPGLGAMTCYQFFLLVLTGVGRPGPQVPWIHYCIDRNLSTRLLKFKIFNQTSAGIRKIIFKSYIQQSAIFPPILRSHNVRLWRLEIILGNRIRGIVDQNEFFEKGFAN